MAVEETEVVSTLDHANTTHYRILNLMAMGLVPEHIAATIKCSTDLVRRIERDPETQKHVEMVQKIGQCMAQVARKDFDELLKLSINAMFEVLTSDKSTFDQKTRASLAIFDRHPDGDFVKTAKNINKEEMEIGFSNDTMRMLKQIADKTNAVIDITPHHGPDSPSGRSPKSEPGPAALQAPATSCPEAAECETHV